MILVVAALVASGCSTNYIPQTRGKVAVVMEAGKPAYMRDGVLYEHGLLGGGLIDAVRGNPGATRAAREYRSRLGNGLLLGLGGLVCSTVAVVAGTARLVREDGADDVPVEMWISLGCFGAMVGGLLYAVTAEPYRWDAVNIFNDTQPQTYPYPGYSTAPGAAPPPQKKMSMKLRD